MPNDINDQLLLDLESAVVKEWFYGHIQSKQVRRLGLGRLMGVIRDRMIWKEQGTEQDDKQLKLAIYSGHDT